jgi:hypothetical protein
MNTGYVRFCSAKAKFFITISLLLTLFACGAPVHTVVTPVIREKMMRDLQDGNLVLVSWNLNTSFFFIGHWREMAESYNAHQWNKLAEQVMTAGHEVDIAYYFLGAAAEHLGYYEASLKFYHRAVVLYTDSIYDHHCRELLSFGGCPLNLSKALPARIANVEGIMRTQAAAETSQMLQGKLLKKTEKDTTQGKSTRQTQPTNKTRPPAAPPMFVRPESTPLEPIIEMPKQSAPTPPQPKTEPSSGSTSTGSDAGVSGTKTPVQEKVRISVPAPEPKTEPAPATSPPQKPSKKSSEDDYS